MNHLKMQIKISYQHFHGQAIISIRSLRSVEQSQQRLNMWQVGGQVHAKRLKLKVVDPFDLDKDKEQEVITHRMSAP